MGAAICGYEHVELRIVRARNVQLPTRETRGSGAATKGWHMRARYNDATQTV